VRLIKRIKKLCGLILVSIIAFATIPLLSAHAYTGGLLNGTAFNLGYNENNTLSTTTLITDNDELSNVSMSARVADTTTKDTAWVSFSVAKDLTAYQFKANGTPDIVFYHSDNTTTEILNGTAVMTGTKTNISLTNVVKIAISGATAFNLYEFDVFSESPPANVTNLTATEGDSQVTLNYTLPTDTDFSHVNIYQDGVKINSVAVTTSSYNVTGLTNGTSYTFKVTSVDTSGSESSGTSVTATPIAPDTTAPSAPTQLSATSADRQISLDWLDNAETDIAGYNVFQDGVKVNTSLITTSTYTVTGLTNGVSYSFTVTAVDTSGNESVKSLAVSSTPSLIMTETTYPATTNIADGDFKGLIDKMVEVFKQSKEAGMYVVGGIIAIAIIFVTARWAWARLRRWLAKMG
jgi:hypothetical protein